MAASAFAFTIDGAITTVAIDGGGPVEHRDAAKRSRDGGPARRERGEDDDVARGWSSAVVERGHVLRRRAGGARRREEAAAAAAASAALGVGAGAALAAKKPLADAGVAFFCLAVL